MAERTPGDLSRIRRKRARGINYVGEELSEEEPDIEEPFDEIERLRGGLTGLFSACLIIQGLILLYWTTYEWRMWHRIGTITSRHYHLRCSSHICNRGSIPKLFERLRTPFFAKFWELIRNAPSIRAKFKKDNDAHIAQLTKKTTYYNVQCEKPVYEKHRSCICTSCLEKT